jgi:hypothetical protein
MPFGVRPCHSCTKSLPAAIRENSGFSTFAPLRDDDARGGRLGKVTLVDTGQVFTTDYRDLEPDAK